MLKIDLSSKIAVVTGAGGQLGRTMARTLAACGADVAVHYLQNREAADKVAVAIRDLGRRACVVQADVADAPSVQAMKQEVERLLGVPDIIVTNAVAQIPWKTVLEQSVESYESQFRSCVLQNVLMTQAFVPAMIERKWGRVIAINTECIMQVFPTQSAYVSGKKGMDALLRVLAKEVGPHGITVNQVAPGWTISDQDRDAGTEVNTEYEKNVPLRRRGQDSEIASAVAFLASDLASYITGVYLPVCGGNVMPAV